MINQHILPAFRVYRHSMGCSAISGEVGWGTLWQDSQLQGLIWRQCKSSYLRVYWVDPCSWRFTIQVPELPVAPDPMCHEKLDLSYRQAIFYPCLTWSLPCPGAVTCRRGWYPNTGFWHYILPSQRKSGSFTGFWTMYHWTCPGGGGGSSELCDRSSAGRVWQLYWPQWRPGLNKPVVVSIMRVSSLPEW